MYQKLINISLRNREPLIFFIIALCLVFFFAINWLLSFRVINLTIAAGPSTAESFQLSQVIAEQLSVYSSHIRLHVLDTKGAEENLALLQAGKVQLASIPMVNFFPSSVKLVTYLFDDLFQLVVSQDSEIKSIADLRGKRIATSLAEDKADNFLAILLEHYGISQNELEIWRMSTEESNAAFLDGRLDAVFRVRPAANKHIQLLVRQGKARIISIDQAAALKMHYPEFEAGILPKGVYQGNTPIPEQNLPTISVRRILLAHDQVPTDAIYAITQLLYEQRHFLLSKMPLANEITPPQREKGIILPLHPGAIRYYDREEPSFIAQNSDVLGLLLTIILAVSSWLWQLKERLTRIQKNRSDLYNRELLHLIEKIKNCQQIESLYELRDILYQQFAVVIDAFDRDQITDESLQSIRFTWEATMHALKDQESYLLNRSRSSPNKYS